MHSAGDGLENPGRVLVRKRTFLQHFGQARPLDQSHGVKRAPPSVTHVVNRDNVIMRQTRGGLCLDSEPAEDGVHSVGLLAVDQLRPDHLERHDPVRRPMPRAENHAHPPVPELLDQLEVRNNFSCAKRLASPGFRPA